jgi:magnesium chelatase subunit I
MIASTLGKIEMETMEDGREAKIHDDLVKRSVLNTFDRYFAASDFESIVAAFEQGSTVDTGAEMAAQRYVDEATKLTGFGNALNKLGVAEDGPAIASAVEFVLEGLHLNRRLNRNLVEGGFRYHA